MSMIASGASLLWRRQRVVWWLFAANLFVGLIASAPLRAQLRGLSASLAASNSLYHHMNAFRLEEALARPEVNPASVLGTSFLAGVAYFVFLLFAMGGVLESLYTDRTPRFGDFLRSSAAFFWRMVRLTLVFAVLMIPVLSLQNILAPLNHWIGNHSDSEQLGFWLTFTVFVAMGLIALAARVWIDVAQLDCVAHERAAVRRSLGRARQLLRGNFWRVYGSVLAIQIVLIACTCALLLVWMKLPHEAIGRTFLIGQLIVLAWIGGRVWQKSAETAWFHERDVAEAPAMAVAAGAADPPAVSVQPSAPDLSI